MVAHCDRGQTEETERQTAEEEKKEKGNEKLDGEKKIHKNRI